LISFASFISIKYQQFLINKLLCKFTSANHHVKKVQTFVFINFILAMELLASDNECK
jgi:hypothetical protein